MRRQQVIWGFLGVLVLAVAFVFVLGRAPRKGHAPLPIERESLGQFPPAPGARGVIAAFPVDLDDDGNYEVIGIRERLSAKQGDAALWTDLNGKFERLPLAVFYERLYMPFPATFENTRPKRSILQRELLGWDATSQRLMRLRRQGGSFSAEAISDERSQRFPDATIFDADVDGMSETLLVYLAPRPTAFRLGPDGRWQPLAAPVPDPRPVIERLHAKVSTKHPNPSGGFSISTPMAFFYQYPRPFVPLPDGDGDNVPEQVDVENRVIRFSTGKQVPFPHPFTAGEQWLIAELDGVAPQEVIYARGSDIHRPLHLGRVHKLPSFKITVYHLKDGKLHPILTQSSPNKLYLALEAIDVDGDGRAELIANTTESGNRTRWTVWRYANGTLTEQSGEHRTDLNRLSDAEWLVRGRRTLAASTTHLHGGGHQLGSGSGTSGITLPFLTARPSVRAGTVLAGIPDGDAAADPKQWKVLAVDGRVVWLGDYDSDGSEEYVLSNPSGGGIAQFREGQWRFIPLETGAPIVAAFPSQHNGQPALIIVYEDGAIERVRLRK
jgi:hypothetical protein